MGCTMSCVSPQKCRFKYSSKSFIRRKSSRLFRKKNPQEGQVKSNSIVNILCYVSPKKEFTPKELEKIQNINWDQKFAYDPFSGWKKSSTSVKNLGKMIYSSKVRFRFQHCQEVHDCYLDLFQTHLHFLSNNTTGLTYQGTLPLKELNVCNLRGSEPGKHAFKITGSCLNHIIIYCSSEEQLEIWLGHLKEQVELNGGTVTSSEAKTYARIKSKRDNGQEKEELRNSVNNEPIYEWEGSQRESLGQVAFVSKVKVQHLPCQDLHNRLLVLYPATLIMLSDEDNCLFYKGKLPLNAITITTHCNDDNPNSFMIEGKLINPIIVSCMDECDYQDWLHHLGTLDVAIEGPQGHVYDPIYTPTKIESPRRSMESCELDSRGSCKVSEKAHSWSYQPPRGSGRSLFEFPEDLASPGYTEPLCYISSRPTSYETQTTRQFSESSGLESSSEESFINIEHSKLRNSPCERDSYASIADSLSPLYSTPYKPGRSCQRDKDMRNNIMRFAADKLPHSYSSPVCLQLSGPPSEKKRRSPHSTINEICTDTPDRWEGCGAFSKFSLLPAPPRMSIQQQEQLNTLEYDPDLLGYQETSDHLEPFRRNKLSNDYDNIWEFHEEPAHAHNSVISHRMDFHLGGEDINTKSTQKRWS
ncbi:probable pleckstrin homology domain-containing family N member 1 [Erpetoichthys calabaricus]|uniref:Pleckstrin homology domain containing, family N member 1 n=1 Tax=Erpetoichthys calabaricus TaxID=27687 RepID=A0A8C4RYQ1_ERPCA|nr:probable pleckstrin homology domain-containing family N member 1 [Erpetoichthys calabaricus]